MFAVSSPRPRNAVATCTCQVIMLISRNCGLLPLPTQTRRNLNVKCGKKKKKEKKRTATGCKNKGIFVWWSKQANNYMCRCVNKAEHSRWAGKRLLRPKLFWQLQVVFILGHSSLINAVNHRKLIWACFCFIKNDPGMLKIHSFIHFVFFVWAKNRNGCSVAREKKSWLCDSDKEKSHRFKSLNQNKSPDHVTANHSLSAAAAAKLQPEIFFIDIT